MTISGRSTAPVKWFERDRERLRRDQAEIEATFSGLVWVDHDAAGWDGILPLWPFDRSAPQFLSDVLGPEGLHLELRYPEAYPMVAPSIRPLNPEPELSEWTVHGWHVNGDGTLCLLRSTALWDPRTSVIDLLLKAAGWRIEYSLRKLGAVDTMTDAGIVTDTRHDGLISALYRRSEQRRR